MAATKYFYYPFAVDGDTTAVPDPTSGAGYVSYQQGWPTNYSLPLASNPSALAIQRQNTNAIFNDITVALQQLQQSGAPDWITEAANYGTAFPYDAGAIVRWSSTGAAPFRTYLNLVQGNTATPGADATWLNLSAAMADSVPLRPVVAGNVFGPDLASNTTYTVTGSFTAPCDGWIDVVADVSIPGVTDAFFGITFATANVADVVSYFDENVQQFKANPVLTGEVSKGAAVSVSVNILTQTGAIDTGYYIGANMLIRFTPGAGVV